MFRKRARDKRFWEKVRADQKYQFLIDELLEIYKQVGQGDLKDISYDVHMEYYKSGNRSLFEHEYYYPRRRRLNVCALLALIYPDNEEYMSNLSNTIWAICNEYCWSLPCHTRDFTSEYNDSYIDLFAAETGYALSEIRFLLEERLSPLINERIRKEIDKRIISSFINNRYDWEEVNSNWAAVCGGSVGCTFLYERPDLFDSIKARIDGAMESFFSSFKEDGVCREGVVYWQYGFGFFVSYAQMLFELTEGKINLFMDERIKKISQFPNVIFIDKGCTISFADGARSSRVGLGTMEILRSHYGDLIPVFPRQQYMTNDFCGRWTLHVNSIVWFDRFVEFMPSPKEQIYYMEDSQWFVKKGTAYGFAAKGGNNAEPHNHNDLGSFIFSRGGRQILTDLGMGEYTRDYFGENRYNILCNRSAGHSVPILDGHEQGIGEKYFAKMKSEGDNLIIDMTQAYPKTGVSSIVRKFSFTENSVFLRDEYHIEKGCTITERFVANIEPRIEKGCVILADTKVLFDSNSWNISVSHEIHVNHMGKQEDVYLIDFTRKDETVTVYSCEIATD